MHNPFDQLAKKIGKGALGASGATTIQYEISRDAQHADIRHDPDPARAAERARLGLLGRIAEVLCIIDVFGHAPDGEELRACMNKHFAHWEECARKARAHNKRRKQKGLPPEPVAEPRLWIVSAAFSTPMLKLLKVEIASDWPTGVYFHGGDLYRVGIIVANRLPRDRSTVLIRIMAAGPVLAEAIADLTALPPEAYEHTVTEDILVHLQQRLGKRPSRTLEEEEFIVAMQGTWRQARELGRSEGEARALLIMLRGRGIPVPDAARERIVAEKDPERLERWIERASVANSLADVLDEPS